VTSLGLSTSYPVPCGLTYIPVGLACTCSLISKTWIQTNFCLQGTWIYRSIIHLEAIHMAQVAQVLLCAVGETGKGGISETSGLFELCLYPAPSMVISCSFPHYRLFQYQLSTQAPAGCATHLHGVKCPLRCASSLSSYTSTTTMSRTHLSSVDTSRNEVVLVGGPSLYCIYFITSRDNHTAALLRMARHQRDLVV
jgi:hypothetical protein